MLDGYRVVITSAHPEYVSRNEIEALDLIHRGRWRLMYLGGNGFFATVSFDPEQPHLMELRRSDGARARTSRRSETSATRPPASGQACGATRDYLPSDWSASVSSLRVSIAVPTTSASRTASTRE